MHAVERKKFREAVIASCLGCFLNRLCYNVGLADNVYYHNLIKLQKHACIFVITVRKCGSRKNQSREGGNV